MILNRQSSAGGASEISPARTGWERFPTISKSAGGATQAIMERIAP
jgi:hypothetical protein